MNNEVARGLGEDVRGYGEGERREAEQKVAHGVREARGRRRPGEGRGREGRGWERKREEAGGKERKVGSNGARRRASKGGRMGDCATEVRGHGDGGAQRWQGRPGCCQERGGT